MAGTIEVTKTYIICPYCVETTTLTVDHLKGRDTKTSWTCNVCGHSIGIEVKDGEFLITKNSGTQMLHGLALLRFPGSNTYFVMAQPRWRPEDNEERQDGDAFFFESHSCPTNWLRRCVKVISDGDSDPHGFLEFVRSVSVDSGLWGEIDDDEIVKLFPEAFTPEQRKDLVG